jgi:hypothetical protein
MGAGRKNITREILEAAKAKGWDARATARHYGLHHRSVGVACERFGITLPNAKVRPAAPQGRDPNLKELVDPVTLKPKRRPIWSASPEAIERAFKNLKGKTNV